MQCRRLVRSRRVARVRPPCRGRIQCPIRGDIDVDHCDGCEWLRLASRGAEVRCAWNRSVLDPGLMAEIVS